MAKSKKNKNKAKLNLTVRDEQRNKLEQMASLKNRSVSNLIEVMADERWKRLAEQQGVAYAKTVAEAMNLKLDMDNPADREKLRRAVLDLVAGRKMPKQKRSSLQILSLVSILRDLFPAKKFGSRLLDSLTERKFRVWNLPASMRYLPSIRVAACLRGTLTWL